MKVYRGTLADRGWIGMPAGRRVRSIAPSFREDYIEDVIASEYANAIYNSELVSTWMDEMGIVPLDFGGGVVAITCMMAYDIPIELLKKLKFYDERGKRRRFTADIAESVRSTILSVAQADPNYNG